MTNNQESDLNRNQGLENFVNKNSTIAFQIVGFSGYFNQFTANNASIVATRAIQEVDRSGLYDNKVFLRKDLAVKAYDIASKMVTYAEITNNLILIKEVNYTETDFIKTADSKTKDKAQVVYDRAVANAAAILPYGVTAAMITGLKTAMDSYKAVLVSTRTAIVERKQATALLKQLFDANNTILAKMDRLLEVVRLTQPAFYNSYYDTRKKIDTGKRYLALKVSVLHSITGEGLPGVRVKLYPQGEYNEKGRSNLTPVIDQVTAKKGGANVKRLEDGIYTAEVSKTGFKPQILTVNISNGDYTLLKIKLVPND